MPLIRRILVARILARAVSRTTAWIRPMRRPSPSCGAFSNRSRAAQVVAAAMPWPVPRRSRCDAPDPRDARPPPSANCYFTPCGVGVGVAVDVGGFVDIGVCVAVALAGADAGAVGVMVLLKEGNAGWPDCAVCTGE